MCLPFVHWDAMYPIEYYSSLPFASDAMSRHTSQMTFYMEAVIEMQFIEKPLIIVLRECVVCFQCVYCVCYTLLL